MTQNQAILIDKIAEEQAAGAFRIFFTESLARAWPQSSADGIDERFIRLQRGLTEIEKLRSYLRRNLGLEEMEGGAEISK